MAESRKVRIRIDGRGLCVLNDGEQGIKYDNNRLILDLAAPQRLVTAERTVIGNGGRKIIEERIEKGEPNGQIILQLSREAL